MRASIGFRLVVSLAMLLPAVAADTWSTAETAAVSEWKNDEGKRYGKALEAAFKKEHSATISLCANETAKPDLTSFKVLLRIDGQGVVQEAMVSPETNIAVCLEGKLAGWKTLPPPHDGFWAKLSLNLNSK